MDTKKFRTRLLGIVLAAVLFIPSQGIAKGNVSTAANTGSPKVAKVTHTAISYQQQPPATDYPGLSQVYGNIPSVFFFARPYGDLNIAYCSGNSIYITTLNADRSIKKLLQIPKEMELVGGITCDYAGNYYIVYGQNDPTNPKFADGNVKVLSVVKYDSGGYKLGEAVYLGNETCTYNAIGWGTKEPFSLGSCDLAWDNSRLIVTYGRTTYSGQQSSHMLYINTETMTKESFYTPYLCHSFDQAVLVASNGLYLFADRNDSSPRGFSLSYTIPDSSLYATFVPFHFRNGSYYQQTYSSLGGIAEIPAAYVLCGTSERSLSYTNAENDTYNEPRDLFVQYFSKNVINKNDSFVPLLQTDFRLPDGTYTSSGYLAEGSVDMGVLWLTQYEAPYYAGNAKVIGLDNGQLLIMWELLKYSEGKKYDTFINSYYMILDYDGRVVQPETIIENTRLSNTIQPVYRNGKILWTTYHNGYDTLWLHELELGAFQDAGTDFRRFDSTSCGPVRNLKAAYNKKGELNFTWDPVLGAKSYSLFVYDGSKKYYDKVNSQSNSVSYRTQNLSGTYYFAILPRSDSFAYYDDFVHMDSPLSITFSKQVKGLKLETRDETVLLRWEGAAYADGYQIYRKTGKDSYELMDTITSGRTTSWTDTAVDSGTKYTYAVCGYINYDSCKISGKLSIPKTIKVK